MKHRNKRFLFGVSVFFVLVLAVSIIMEIQIISSNQAKRVKNAENSKSRQSISADLSGNDQKEKTKQQSETEDSSASKQSYQNLETIDFSKLQKQNQDVYAWIEIPGTRIDYPVLQNQEDDTYYLKYNLNGSKGYPGCIYSEKENAKDFSDFDTVLYGHNMKNGTMFHDLHLYEKKEFFENHKFVYIYLPEKTLVYTVFAAYAYDDRHILNTFDFKKTDVREEYLNDMQQENKNGIYGREGISVSAQSQILTLSTCEAGRANERFLVQTVLTDEMMQSNS